MKWIKLSDVWVPLNQTTLTESDWYILKYCGRRGVPGFIPTFEGDEHPLIALADEDAGQER